MAGYDRPILHGLCSFGHAARAVLQEYCGNDTSKFGGFGCRFSGVVYPGDTITTDMWDEGSGKVLVQSRTQDGRIVISNGAAECGRTLLAVWSHPAEPQTRVKPRSSR